MEERRSEEEEDDLAMGGFLENSMANQTVWVLWAGRRQPRQGSVLGWLGLAVAMSSQGQVWHLS